MIRSRRSWWVPEALQTSAIDCGPAALISLLRGHEITASLEALRTAWKNGVILAGLSAGAVCWFESFTTDSFLMGGADPAAGLGFLIGSFSPHYSNEPIRRPSFHALIAGGTLPAGYACDDFAAIHFLGEASHQAITSHPDAHAYRVNPAGESSFEEHKLTAAYLG